MRDNVASAQDTPDDAYGVLGLKEDAAPDEIKRAYRALALKWHPDKVLPDKRSQSEKLFKTLGTAYDILRDPQRRQQYDQKRSFHIPDASPFEVPVASTPPSSAMERRRLFRQRSAVRSAASHMRSDSDLLGSKPQTAANGLHSSQGRMAATFGMMFGVPGQAKLAGLHVLGGHRPVSAPDGLGIDLQGRPPSCRIAFSAGSASLGKDRNGQYAKELAATSLIMLRAVSQWVAASPGQRLIEIRGCVQKGEVEGHQQESLGFARSQNTLDFLADECFVPAERCRLSNRLGDAYVGVEIRAMSRFDVAPGSYAKPDSLELKESQLALKAVASALGGSGSDKKRLFVEVQYSSFSERMANRRLAALLQALIVHDISRRRFRGQVRAGLADEADFYVYDELPPP